MKQLSEVGLIEKKKRGQGKPDIIYVMNFTAVHKEGAKEIVLEEQMEQDYQDKLAYILMHPFRNWFNRKTPAVIGIALTVWAMFVCYYLTYYRNFHPDAEHGVAEWADVPKTAKRLYGKGEEPVTCLSKNITVNVRIRELAERFELTNDLAQPIAAYSHGMKQKLAIISAWLHAPQLVVMDEPFVGLDPKAAHLLKGMMRELCDRGGAIFFSTHVREVAEKLCDKVAILRAGKLIRSGTMDEVKGDDSLEEVFLELEGETC